MSLYQVDIEKLREGEYWTNVYHTVQPDLESARTAGLTFVDAERSVHHISVLFTRMRVSDTTSDFFDTEPINQYGLGNPPGDPLPLFNVVRVDFGVNAHRSLRKYLRLPLMESQQHNGIIENDALVAIAANYGAPLETGGQLASPAGNGVTSVVVNPAVGMRQLRRGSKRKKTPVLP